MDKRVPDMVMVPREPTERMLRAAAGHMRVDTLYTPKSIWRAMLSAAPSEGGDEPSSPGPAVDRVAGVVVPRAGDMVLAPRWAFQDFLDNAPGWPDTARRYLNAPAAPPPSVGEGVREALADLAESRKHPTSETLGFVTIHTRNADAILAALRPDAGGA